jgi:hypothetical protein
MTALKPGTAILIPANTPRYVWAKDGTVDPGVRVGVVVIMGDRT